MIEWIPIKDFKIDKHERYLAYSNKHRAVMTVENWVYTNEPFPEDFTHAAKINFPAEKTLEEKFSEYHLALEWMNEDNNLFKGLAKIAKEHYEGKE